MKILVTGSTYWNCGDDLVRHGAMNVLRNAVAVRHGVKERCSFFLHSFSHPDNMHSPLREDLNLVYPWEVEGYARKCDLILVPGLAVGFELQPFFEGVRRAGAEHKLIFIGGMNENGYCDTFAGYPEMRETFKRARVVIGRTEKHPLPMDACPGGYHWLPCPSIFANSVPGEGYPMLPKGPVLFSIQLPHGHPNAVVNHATDEKPVHVAAAVMNEWADEHGANDVRLVAHHKSEALTVFDERIPVEFHTEEQYTDEVYRACRCVVSTRLHAVLRAESMGIPSLLVNQTPRHKHAMKQYPHIPVTLDKAEINEWLGKSCDMMEVAAYQRVVLAHRWTNMNNYLDILKHHV